MIGYIINIFGIAYWQRSKDYKEISSVTLSKVNYGKSNRNL